MGPHKHITGRDEKVIVKSGSNDKNTNGMARWAFHPVFTPWSFALGQPQETEVSETLVPAGDTVSQTANAVMNVSKSPNMSTARSQW